MRDIITRKTALITGLGLMAAAYFLRHDDTTGLVAGGCGAALALLSLGLHDTAGGR